MSLISGKTLISPFTNKIHLVTIVVVSLAFGIFRLSGGGFESRPLSMRKTMYDSPRMMNAATHSSTARSQDEEDNTYVAPSAANSGHFEVEKPVAAKAAPANRYGAIDGSAERKTGGKATGSNNDSLDDIEKTLGLHR